ncbi:hypothetical protein [Burkholderia gladioli]
MCTLNPIREADKRQLAVTSNQKVPVVAAWEEDRLVTAGSGFMAMPDGFERSEVRLAASPTTRTVPAKT